jgi:hypothetical protein
LPSRGVTGAHAVVVHLADDRRHQTCDGEVARHLSGIGKAPPGPESERPATDPDRSRGSVPAVRACGFDAFRPDRQVAQDRLGALVVGRRGDGDRGVEPVDAGLGLGGLGRRAAADPVDLAADERAALVGGRGGEPLGLCAAKSISRRCSNVQHDRGEKIFAECGEVTPEDSALRLKKATDEVYRSGVQTFRECSRMKRIWGVLVLATAALTGSSVKASVTGTTSNQNSSSNKAGLLPTPVSVPSDGSRSSAYHYGFVTSDATSGNQYGQWGGTFIEVNTTAIGAGTITCPSKHVFFYVGDALPSQTGMIHFATSSMPGIWMYDATSQAEPLLLNLPAGPFAFQAFIQPTGMGADVNKIPYTHALKMYVEKKYGGGSTAVTDYALAGYPHFLVKTWSAGFSGTNNYWVTKPTTSTATTADLNYWTAQHNKSLYGGLYLPSGYRYTQGAIYQTISASGLKTLYTTPTSSGGWGCGSTSSYHAADEKLALDMWIYKQLSTSSGQVNTMFTAMSLTSTGQPFYSSEQSEVSGGGKGMSGLRSTIDAGTNRSAIYNIYSGTTNTPVRVYISKWKTENLKLWYLHADHFTWEPGSLIGGNTMDSSAGNAIYPSEDPFLFNDANGGLHVVSHNESNGSPCTLPGGESLVTPSHAKDFCNVLFTNHTNMALSANSYALHDTSDTTDTPKLLLALTQASTATNTIWSESVIVSGNVPINGTNAGNATVFLSRQMPDLWFDVNNVLGLNPTNSNVSGLFFSGSIWAKWLHTQAYPYSVHWGTPFFTNDFK